MGKSTKKKTSVEQTSQGQGNKVVIRIFAFGLVGALLLGTIVSAVSWIITSFAG